jgi:hypothetical protein
MVGLKSAKLAPRWFDGEDLCWPGVSFRAWRVGVSVGWVSVLRYLCWLGVGFRGRDGPSCELSSVFLVHTFPTRPMAPCLFWLEAGEHGGVV